MDVVSALAIASSAFKAIKKGFEYGRDAESMMKDVSRWLSADEVIKKHQGRPKTGKSVTQESLELFAQIKKHKKQEDELRNFLIATYGINAWNELLRLQAKIRTQRREEREAKKRREQEIIKMVGVFFIVIFLGLILVWLISRNIR